MRVGLVLGDVALRVFNDDDGIIDHSPVASVIPNSVRELIEKPKTLMKANVPISETGIVTAGITVARQSSRKKKMTMMTMITASSRVVTTSSPSRPRR